MKINLRDRLAEDKIMIMPGVYDALTALLAQQAGMEAVFLSGSSVSYSQLGRPDIGLVTMSEMVDICARVTDRVNTLVPTQIMVDKIKAVVDARENTQTLVSARSDAAFSESLEQVLERITLYREAGADILFAEGLKRVDDVRQIVKAADGVPVLYNLLHNDGELRSAEDLDRVGVSIALFPANAVLASTLAVRQAFAELKANPKLNSKGFDLTTKDLNAALGTPEMLEKYKNFSS